MKRISLAVVAFAAFTSFSHAQTLIGFWNFNNGSSATTGPSGDLTAAQLAPYLNPAVGNGTLTFSGDRSRLVTGFSENLPTSDPGGTGIGLSLQIPKGFSGGSGNPPTNEGSNLTFSLSTTGYENLVMSFAGTMANQSFTNINVSYSVGGGAFTSFQDFAYGGTLPGTVPAGIGVVDFSSISSLDNAAQIAVRLTFTGALTAGTNNVRFDNFQFNATAVPEPSTYALIALGGALVAARVLRRRRQAQS